MQSNLLVRSHFPQTLSQDSGIYNSSTGVSSSLKVLTMTSLCPRCSTLSLNLLGNLDTLTADLSAGTLKYPWPSGGIEPCLTLQNLYDYSLLRLAPKTFEQVHAHEIGEVYESNTGKWDEPKRASCSTWTSCIET